MDRQESGGNRSGKMRLIDRDNAIRIRRDVDRQADRQALRDALADVHQRFQDEHGGPRYERFTELLVDKLHESGLKFAFSNGEPYNPTRAAPSYKVISNFLRWFGTPQGRDHEAVFFQFVQAALAVCENNAAAQLSDVDFDTLVALYLKRYVRAADPDELGLLEQAASRLEGVFWDFRLSVPGWQTELGPYDLLAFRKISGVPLLVTHLLRLESADRIIGENPFRDAPALDEDINLTRFSGLTVPTMDAANGLRFSTHLTPKIPRMHPINLELGTDWNPLEYFHWHDGFVNFGAPDTEDHSPGLGARTRLVSQSEFVTKFPAALEKNPAVSLIPNVLADSVPQPDFAYLLGQRDGFRWPHAGLEPQKPQSVRKAANERNVVTGKWPDATTTRLAEMRKYALSNEPIQHFFAASFNDAISKVYTRTKEINSHWIDIIAYNYSNDVL